MTTAHRYTYLAEPPYAVATPDSITTVDTTTGVADRYTSADNTVCEPLFAEDPPENPGEGRGWLLSLEHRPSDKRSRLVVLNAERPSAGPVATATLRNHVPMTFHGAYKPWSSSC